jgi:hypothetical protein
MLTSKNNTDRIVVRTPDLVTAPCQTYLDEYHGCIEYMIFISRLAAASDRVQETARRALEEIQALSEEEMVNHIAASGRTTQTLRDRHSRMILETVLCRCVDNLLTYIADMLRLIFSIRPETLKSGEKISFKEALSQVNMTDLIAYITDKKVNELSYMGLNALNGYCVGRLGMDLFLDNNQRLSAIKSVEARNIIVHNRSKINQIYCRKAGFDRTHIGNLISISFDAVVDAAANMTELAISIGQRASLKFELFQKKTGSKGNKTTMPSDN